MPQWLRYVLLVVLVPLAGVLGLVGATGIMHPVVMAPYEAAEVSSTAAAVGAVARFASATVDAAAAASSDPAVRAALKQKQATLSTEAEAGLLAKAGSFGAPSFALLVGADGGVIAKAGRKSSLPSSLAGFPAVAESLTGIARDGLWVQDGKPVHVAAAGIWDGNAIVGSVLLGWPWDEDQAEGNAGEPTLIDRLRPIAMTEFFIIGREKAAVFGKATKDAPNTALLAGASSFGDPTKLYGALPIMVKDARGATDGEAHAFRYGMGQTALYPSDPSFVIATLIDRDPAYTGLASLQAGIIVLVFLLMTLVLVIVISTKNAFDGPLEIMIEHLSQWQQGKNVGNLPEAGLSGTARGGAKIPPQFLRLSKQINSLLQGMPATRPGASLSTGSPPLSSPTFDGGGAEPAQPFAEPRPRAPTAIPPPPAAFQQARAFTPQPQPQQANGNGSAGASGGLKGLFDDGPDPLAPFRVPSRAMPVPAPAAPPAAPPPPEEPEEPSAMNPEATVMFQVPAELLEASQADARRPEARDAAASSRAANSLQKTAPGGFPHQLPEPAANVDDNRTVVAQVPQELLAQVAPKNDIGAADGAHYKEVYEKFVQSRIECGEDTSDLSYERFVAKLLKNRAQIVEKHKAKSVRFQVYVKDGKAALRALPVRD